MDSQIRSILETDLKSSGFSYGRDRKFRRQGSGAPEIQVTVEVESNSHENWYVDVVAEFTGSRRGVVRVWRFSQARSMSIREGFYKLNSPSVGEFKEEVRSGLERGTIPVIEALTDASQASWVFLRACLRSVGAPT